jgi:membrane protein implicated in regulation of membrane protease activity
MTWPDFYLLCFIVGFALSVLSFLGGAVHLHLPFKLHLPFHAGHTASGAGHGHGIGGKAVSHGGGQHISWFNASTAMAFLAWFGGVGYVLSVSSRLMGVAILGFASVAGLFAGALIFKFMAKLMQSPTAHLRDEDYRFEGSVGTISMPIRAGGTGEVIFLQQGVRRSAAARSEDGQPVEKEAEVVIERYEHGIAYVKRWDEFTR